MFFELLEFRQLFAFTLSFDAATQTLHVNGDGARNEIVVTQTSFDTHAEVTITDGAQRETRRTSTAFTTKPTDIHALEVNAGGGNDSVRVEASVELRGRLLGGSGADELRVLATDFWSIDGGTGADRMYGDPRSARVTADYSSRTAPLYVNLNVANGDGEAGENDHLDPSIANVALGSGNDYFHDSRDGTLTSAGGENHVLGGRGDDVLIGTAGADSFSGEEGNDVLAGGAYIDFLNGGPGFDTLYGEESGPTGQQLNGGEDPDLIFGGPDADSISGGDGDDQIAAGGGDDVIYGGEGNDRIDGGFGADEIIGSGGWDTLDYSWRTANLVVTIGGRGGETGENDNVHDTVEAVWGGAGNDRISVASTALGDFDLIGNAGNDMLTGGAGNDVLDGGHGSDLLYGMDGRDWLVGGAGMDYLDGGWGNDGLDARDGEADWLVGGAGDDDRAYADSTALDFVSGVETIYRL